MKIFPAIDILNGKCVRLSKGDFDSQKVYDENPFNMAMTFEKAGIKQLHLVDLDGARAGKVVNWNIIRSIVNDTSLRVDVGGGIKTEEEIEELFKVGVDKVNIGSIAVQNPALVKDWIKKYGSEKIVLSADCRNERIAVGAWQNETSIPVIDFILDFLKAGISYVTCTDIGQDGTLSGPNLNLYSMILRTTNNPLPITNLIASGGVSSKGDLIELEKIGCYGCIVGKAFYEGRIQIDELIS